MADIPSAIRVISILGVLPFLLGAITTFKLNFIDPTLNLIIRNVIIIYGAIILSFLGGCLFGFECMNRPKPNNLRLWISILPAIWALIAIQISNFSASILAIGFLLVYEFDRRAYTAGIVPSWWLSLRLPLTFTVILCLSIMGFYNEG